MNKPNYSLLAAALCVLLALSSAAAGEKIAIQDDLGRNLTINSPSERIVFTMENALKTYYAIGDPKNVAALKDDQYMQRLSEDIFSKVDPNFNQKLTVRVDGDLLNLEDLAKANPDLVVLWATSDQDPNLKAINETLKVPVYAVFVDSLDDLFRQVEVMGKIAGDGSRASEVEGVMKKYVARVTDVTSKISQDDKPKVYWMWTDAGGLGTAGVKSGINDLIEEAGGINVMQYADNDTRDMEHPTLSLETLVSLNPDVIYMWYNEKVDPEDILTGEEYRGWKEINAVKNGRVYEIENPYLFDAFSPRLPLALMHVAKDLHPEEFAGLNMSQEIDQYHVEMFGVNYSA